jgi:hypothetical protein
MSCCTRLGQADFRDAGWVEHFRLLLLAIYHHHHHPLHMHAKSVKHPADQQDGKNQVNVQGPEGDK